MKWSSMKWLLVLAVCVICQACVSTKTPEKPKPQTNPFEAQLVGTRPISLQWISWEDFGSAKVVQFEGVLTIEGEQRSKENDDYLLIVGTITKVSSVGFEFNGIIEIQVSHLNGGKPYRREGKSTFRTNPERGRWRLVEMKNADGAVDYVDIYFDMESAKKEPDM